MKIFSRNNALKYIKKAGLMPLENTLKEYTWRKAKRTGYWWTKFITCNTKEGIIFEVGINDPEQIESVFVIHNLKQAEIADKKLQDFNVKSVGDIDITLLEITVLKLSLLQKIKVLELINTF